MADKYQKLIENISLISDDELNPCGYPKICSIGFAYIERGIIKGEIEKDRFLDTLGKHLKNCDDCRKDYEATIKFIDFIGKQTDNMYKM